MLWSPHKLDEIVASKKTIVENCFKNMWCVNHRILNDLDNTMLIAKQVFLNNSVVIFPCWLRLLQHSDVSLFSTNEVSTGQANVAVVLILLPPINIVYCFRHSGGLRYTNYRYTNLFGLFVGKSVASVVCCSNTGASRKGRSTFPNPTYKKGRPKQIRGKVLQTNKGLCGQIKYATSKSRDHVLAQWISFRTPFPDPQELMVCERGSVASPSIRHLPCTILGLPVSSVSWSK